MPTPVLRPRQTQSISGASEGRTSISSATNQPPARPAHPQRCPARDVVSDEEQRDFQGSSPISSSRASVPSLDPWTDCRGADGRTRGNTQAGGLNHEKMTDVMSSTEARQLAVALAAKATEGGPADWQAGSKALERLDGRSWLLLDQMARSFTYADGTPVSGVRGWLDTTASEPNGFVAAVTSLHVDGQLRERGTPDPGGQWIPWCQRPRSAFDSWITCPGSGPRRGKVSACDSTWARPRLFLTCFSRVAIGSTPPGPWLTSKMLSCSGGACRRDSSRGWHPATGDTCAGGL